jgi:hypothetical protein
MQTIVTVPELKSWLRLPVAADEELDTRLASLLVSACTQIGDATGLALVLADGADLPSVPEPIKTAVTLLAASWFENPVPDQKAQESAQFVVDSLIAKYRTFTYPSAE